MLSAQRLYALDEAPPAYDDPAPQRYELKARASEVDSRTREHPEIDFVFTKNDKPVDIENAIVDTGVVPRGKLVIWLMGHSPALFERVADYGFHAIQIHYANGWFGKLSKLAPPGDDKYLGRIRLEAAIGEDVSDAVDIPKPDSIMSRSFRFVKWLAKENPQGRWDYFITDDGTNLRWDRVILAGSSHGSTTAARFAIYQRVDRVVMFCGPRDNFDTWQALPSATHANRFFGFSHVLDGGWSADHYCRSWELLGLHRFGPIVDVEHAKPPYGNTRRLVTKADVGGDAGRAHSAVTPGSAAVKDSSGKFLHEPVWLYLFTHPVDAVGKSTLPDPDCLIDQR
ncbi:MAG: hypothetical protein K8U03_26990 [Planctomycetia bacterium]|nr:hypothetical protein [Planctomycetia bacterium]